MGVLTDARQRCYSREDLEMFTLLESPIHVFDIEEKCMWWANQGATDLWNAETLEDLVARDFASDMSVSTERRLNDYLRRFEKGESVSESWTMYPKGKQITVNVLCSGIHLKEKGGRLAMLCHSEYTTMSPLNEKVDRETLRSVEMLRHVPMAVSQFDLSGITLTEQNPEAMAMFGAVEDTTSSTSSRSSGIQADSRANGVADYDSSSMTECNENENCFLSRFLDQVEGRYVLEEVQAGRDCSVEAQQYTTQGTCWFAIKVRQSRDPVTQEPVILYSARDISKTMQAMNEADRANMEKSEMLAVLSHEIRTPLHQVIGFIELLDQTVLNLEQSSYTNSLQTAASSLMTIINDVLDFTKLEAGKMELESIPFDPIGVCVGCIEIVAPVAKKRGLTVTSNTTSETSEKLTVIGDPNRLRQVVLNLLSNALKFTHEGGVTLTFTAFEKEQSGDTTTADECANWLRFVVEDTGIGISWEQRQIIFDKYKQTDAAVARQYGGTGLGLSICKILTEAMGGTISVESELNAGSKFIVEIPTTSLYAQGSNVDDLDKSTKVMSILRDDMQTDETLSTSSYTDINNPEMEGWIGRWKEQNVQDANNFSSSHSLHFIGPSSTMEILVAEDNKLNQKLLGSMLTRAGFQFKIVSNGLQAVEEVEKGDYKLCLMDIQMPELDGIGATQQIRDNGWGKKDLPIVGLTASFQSADLDYYLSIGMNDCVGKPVRLPVLKEIIHEYVDGVKC